MPRVPAPLLLLGLLCLAVVTSRWPLLALGLVWPFLFFVPGWWLAARAAPALSPAGRAGVAVVVSVYLSSHVVYALSRVMGGFGTAPVLVATAGLVAATVTLATAAIPGLAPPPRVGWSATLAAWRRQRPAWGVALAATVVVGAVLGISLWHRTPAGWVSGGWNWSDLLVHVSIAASIQQRNFPPQVPYFAGVPLLYHWFADFHAAIAATSGHVDVTTAMACTGALMAGSLALLVWELGSKLTGSGRAATLASSLAVFGGGMGFIRLPLDLMAGRGSIAELVAHSSYDNTWTGGWPYFRVASTLGTGLLTHRATALGLPGMVAVLLLVHLSWGRSGSGVLLAGAVAALLAPFDFFAFPAAYVLVLVQLLVGRGWRSPGAPLHAALFAAPLLWALPFVVGPALLQHGHGTVRLVGLWPDAPREDGVAAVAFFYVTNLGVPFVLAGIAALIPALPHRGLLVAWAAVLFAIPNVIGLSYVTFDMNRYFQMMWVPTAILAGWLIHRWPRPVIGALVTLSVLSPALVSIWNLTSTTVTLSAGEEEAARWIERSTPPLAVFVTPAFINSPVDLAGRLRLTSFGPYISNLGYDPSSRERDVQAIYCGGAATAIAVMRRDRATYVLSGRPDCGASGFTDFTAGAGFDAVYDRDGVSVWRLRAP